MAVETAARRTPVDRAVNIGPILSRRLVAAGVDTLERLAALGALRAWALIEPQTPAEERVHTLLALEGAIRSMRWTALPAAERRRLLEAAGLDPG